jgi:hypothetical protein
MKSLIHPKKKKKNKRERKNWQERKKLAGGREKDPSLLPGKPTGGGRKTSLGGS